MSVNDLPGTLETKHNPGCANPSSLSTTAQETEASKGAAPGLDLRGYELLDRLGGGGMGDVYRAADPALGRDLAVKVIKADLRGNVSAESRFVREARITGSLQHPSIVPIYNLGRLADGRLHYTMRLVRGRTLAAILHEEAGKPECLPALLTIFEKVCQATAYAHSKHVIHRDLKPANVMVGRYGEVQVMDWGLAKLLTGADEAAATERKAEKEGTRIHTEAADTPTEQTRMGHEMGTPAYMPPEQALGEWDTVDERADVFAIGAILCAILTGQPPYGSHDSGEALRKAKRGEMAEALARLANCGADAALVGLCRDCLATAREGRPRDAEQVTQRVAAYQAEVQERLRRAELERATAVVKATGERKKRRWMLTAVVLLLAGAAVSTLLAVWALTAEGKAQTRLGQMEKANEVLTSIFRDLDPRAEEKGEPSLRQQLSQHLERAATQLDEEVVGDAVAAARLQTALGLSLNYLGRSKLAIELLDKAGRTLDAKLGPDHPDTLTCRNNLGEAYRYAGRIAESISLFEQSLKQREAKLGIDHQDTLLSRHNLAKAYLDAGRIAESIRLHEQNLKLREAKLGPDHLDTLSSRHNLANAYYDAGRIAEATRLYEQILKQRETRLGPDHRDTQHSRNNLANAYLYVGRTAEAIQMYEQTLKQSEAKLGSDHRDTFLSRANLADAYRDAGRTAEALRLLEPNLKQSEAKLGPDHPLTLNFRTSLANAYLSIGRADEAIRLYEQNLKLQKDKIGTDHPDTLLTRGCLANAYLSAGRTDEAIRLYEPTLKQQQAKLGNDHPAMLQTMTRLGLAYRDAGRLKEAIPLLETALLRGREHSGGLPPSLAGVPGALAETYERADLFAKAEIIYRDLLEQAQRKYGYEDPRTAAALMQLAANLLKQKKFSAAEPLLRQCLIIRDKTQPDDWTTFLLRSVLGEALLGQKKYAEAEPLLVQGYDGMKQRQDKIPPAYRQLRLSEALERVVRLYKATDQQEKAAAWRKKPRETKDEPKKAKP
ncbi:MAG: tetratricopeptide repeat protein [Gemmataceae bacterium]